MATTYNAVVQQNATWEVTLTMTNPDGSPFILTDFTGQSQVKTTYDSVSVLTSPVVTIVSALEGKLKVHMSLVQTALLPITSTSQPPKPPLPVYDVVIGNTDKSRVFVVLSGNMTVKPGVTEWTP
jgi:hypothetical protein